MTSIFGIAYSAGVLVAISIPIFINYNSSKGYVDTIDVVVNIKSKKPNNWSGLGSNLPSPLNTIKDNKANPGRYLLAINFNSSGKPTGASLINVIHAWESDPMLQ